ncbi:DUF805 domain-containing protein [Rhizobium laguerreae]|uniref:DUF805 domain-containing protein n=1 Tax=Rhizobium laguerreae TaxID=1076926 RepID=UPI001C8FB794|nr:DUF805 domain-containing protein [Rhizobium laguerreae]MBY3256336.1 DUF805 domain-containing protein [Rhizobium laguerreae]MBY3270114.1 DUF805 domain-containing protein [Rhizobium laguerreae]MBY3285253.1 DUF805 domain-containing protein [Rhizobium laguerreae]MBY3291225.1 DUF805 domain-containing protein [Rhizobium laguerreae]MBY3326272.1 DUF805 domain-containing protein [Rhizobium laguerreae]
MGFTEAVRTVLTQKYATFSGRASRSEFWWFQLFYVLVLIALLIVASLAGAFSDIQDDGPSSVLFAFGAVGGLFALAMFLPQISLQVRRFHDRNISAWYYLALFILNMIPAVGFIGGLAMLVICVLRGTEGPNKFGPDPLRPEVRAEVFA